MHVKTLVCVCLSVACAAISAVPVPDDVNFYKDIEYARVADSPLLLDIYIPRIATKPLPLIIWVHGGGWCKGTKSKAFPVAMGFTSKGYAVASVEYRFTNKAIFPAQIWDCKAAVRFLRGNANKYSLDPNRFGAWGDSAGGHLVALLGTTCDSRVLDGDEGSHVSTSSSVQAVCEYYGPTDFTAIAGSDPNSMWLKPDTYGAKLIGGPILENIDKARAASPLTYVSSHDVPFLIVHGKQDMLVPVSQSISFYEALKKAGVPAKLKIISDAVHGGKVFSDPNVISTVQEFFDEHLKESSAGK